MGRPSKYTPELLERAQDYIAGVWKEEGDVVPNIEGLSLYLDITRETINAWSKHEDKVVFSDIVKALKTDQARNLINKGLSGDYNAAMAKLMLGKHGYSDKVDNTHTFKLPKDMTEDEIRAELKERREANPL